MSEPTSDRSIVVDPTTIASLNDDPVTTTDAHGNVWQEIPTGRWVVQWDRYSVSDWHGKPFTRDPEVVATEQVAQAVLEEVRAWLTQPWGPWGEGTSQRPVSSAVIASPEADAQPGDMAIIACMERRTVRGHMVTKKVEVEGETYTKTEEVITYGEWTPEDVATQWLPARWPEVQPYPDGRTRWVTASIRPEVVRVLLSCGRREEAPDAP